MSYRCDNCQEAQPSGHAPTRVITEIRHREYSDRFSSSVGSEIVSEANCCPDCLGPVQEAANAQADASRQALTEMIRNRDDSSFSNDGFRYEG